MKPSSVRLFLAGLAALAASAAAAAQRLGGGSAPEVSIVRIVGALIVCLIVAFLAIFYLKHRSGGSAQPMFRGLIKTNPEIDVREVRRLTVQHSLGLVRHQDQEYLLLLSPGDSLVLSERRVEGDSVAEGGQ